MTVVDSCVDMNAHYNMYLYPSLPASVYWLWKRSPLFFVRLCKHFARERMMIIPGIEGKKQILRYVANFDVSFFFLFCAESLRRNDFILIVGHTRCTAHMCMWLEKHRFWSTLSMSSMNWSPKHVLSITVPFAWVFQSINRERGGSIYELLSQCDTIGPLQWYLKHVLIAPALRSSPPNRVLM